MPLPTPEFEEGQQWDGTTPRTRPDTNIFKRSDGEIAGRHSSEILALEELLKDVVAQLEVLENFGGPNTVLSVRSDQTGLEWSAAASAGAAISGTAGEALAEGDLLYILAADGKAYKALADADVTSVVIGCTVAAASADDTITIILIGDITNSGWTLTTGNSYYLSAATAGAFTDTAPSTTGEFVVPVGIATSTTTLTIGLRIRVKL